MSRILSAVILVESSRTGWRREGEGRKGGSDVLVHVYTEKRQEGKCGTSKLYILMTIYMYMYSHAKHNHTKACVF